MRLIYYVCKFYNNENYYENKINDIKFYLYHYIQL